MIGCRGHQGWWQIFKKVTCLVYLSHNSHYHNGNVSGRNSGSCIIQYIFPSKLWPTVVSEHPGRSRAIWVLVSLAGSLSWGPLRMLPSGLPKPALGTGTGKEIREEATCVSSANSAGNVKEDISLLCHGYSKAATRGKCWRDIQKGTQHEPA